MISRQRLISKWWTSEYIEPVPRDIERKGDKRGRQDEQRINSSRRRRNHDLFLLFILFSGHAASGNTFLKRLFIMSDFSAEWPRRAKSDSRPISVDSNFQLGPRGALLFQLGIPSLLAGSLIKTSIRAGEDLSGEDAKNGRENVYRVKREIKWSLFSVLFWLFRSRNRTLFLANIAVINRY